MVAKTIDNHARKHEIEQTLKKNPYHKDKDALNRELAFITRPTPTPKHLHR